ncbi:hypothetical protein V6N11_052964 [Hibiscus sabdariffa]|uniref:Uncharacterized protein n=1 Tax=Hibiscus sabdariffa TaxID=183260 RepID=A0ABR2UC86_9ROSI
MTRRRVNRSSALQDDDGSWCTKDADLKKLALKFYGELFSSSLAPRPIYGTRGAFPSLEECDNSWLEELVPLASYASARNSANMAPTSVASMVDQEGQWKWHLFERFLPNDIILRIAAVKPSSSTTIAYSIAWGGSRDRRFTVKFAYSLISNDAENILEGAHFIVDNTVVPSDSPREPLVDVGTQHVTVGVWLPPEHDWIKTYSVSVACIPSS